MSSVCLYFQVHQPCRFHQYSFFDIGQNPFYENEDATCEAVLKMAKNCYLPGNEILLNAIRQHKGKFKVTFSISGSALDLFEIHAPEVIESFQALAKTGCVEFLGETYHHSMAFLYSLVEFKEQVEAHKKKIQKLFGYKTTAFRNTELIYRNDLAELIEQMGYKAILCEGADHVLAWRSPNYVYKPKNCDKLRVLMKNYHLSDDIAQRFSQQDWEAYPLTADAYASWLHNCEADADSINLFMNYEVFGDYHDSESGIFHFLQALPEKILSNPNFDFKTVSEIAKIKPKGSIDVQDFMSWTDAERDLNSWLGNDMQKDSIHACYALEPIIRENNNPELHNIWRHLQASEHFHAMSTKWYALKAAKPYSHYYDSPYDAYINYMNILADLELRAKATMPQEKKSKRKVKEK